MDSLRQTWQPGTVVLASHARLERSLREAYDRRQRAAGRLSWPRAPVTTWEGWLEQSWAACGDRLLLRPLQEHWLWRQIISASAGAGALLDVAATAAAVASAWRLAQLWQIPWSQLDWQGREETAAFYAWARELRRRCAAESWITAAELPAAVTEAVRSRALPAPTSLLLAGSEELPPQWNGLLSALGAAGTQWQRLPPPQAEAAVAQVGCFADPAEEWEAAAAWARARLESGAAGPIGVIVPGLAGARAQVERIFLAEMHPRRPPWDDAPRAFHLSLGEPLEQAPMIAAALAWIELLQASGPNAPPLEPAALLAALRSPFLAAAESEAAARARLEREIRRQQRPGWSWSEVVRCATFGCPVLAARLRAARQCRGAWPARQSHAAWVESFTAIWDALGWRGERPLNSAGFQLQRAWQRLLDDFERLDQILPAAIGAGEALARLRHAAEGRIFQPEAGAAPVQVLGWLEAGGLEFSHLWVSGMDDQAVPAGPQPHPFLPWEWQRAAGLPYATAERARDFAARHWQALLRHCPEVVASHACADEREQPLRPSPLLTGCASLDPAAVPGTVSAPAAAAMEWLDDALGPAAGADERHGGSTLLRDQSACPFRAFAHHRLHAERARAIEPGLPATTRGSLLHQLLDKLWRELQTSAQLHAETSVQLAARVTELAGEVVAAEPALASLPGLAAVECQRLADVVNAWLQLEFERRPFRVVDIENRATVPFAGLNLTLQRDRVDELAEGAHAGERVLVDYKSGIAGPSLWGEPRLQEPQLPLYLLTDPERGRVAALAFAQVRAGDMRWAGIEREEALLTAKPLLKSRQPCPWEEQLARWQTALEALAAEFERGVAGVQPRDGKCCDFCDLTALCRIRESGLYGGRDEDGENEGNGDGD